MTAQNLGGRLYRGARCGGDQEPRGAVRDRQKEAVTSDSSARRGHRRQHAPLALSDTAIIGRHGTTAGIGGGRSAHQPSGESSASCDRGASTPPAQATETTCAPLRIRTVRILGTVPGRAREAAASAGSPRTAMVQCLGPPRWRRCFRSVPEALHSPRGLAGGIRQTRRRRGDALPARSDHDREGSVAPPSSPSPSATWARASQNSIPMARKCSQAADSSDRASGARRCCRKRRPRPR